MPVKKRILGRTGIEISELIFGGGWVGGILIHGDDDTRRAAIARALAAGINWIDTAPSYGQGKSEEALGWLLKEVEPQPHISTKVSIDCENLGDIAGQVERSIEGSLKRLDRDNVDLVFLHNRIDEQTAGRALSLEHLLGKGGVADAMDGLRAQGLTRFIGLTASGSTARCCDAVASGRFDAAQVYYNMLNPSAARASMPAEWTGHDFSGLMNACTAAECGIVVIRALAAGVLATDTRHGREVVMTENSEIPKEELRARAAMEALGLNDDGMTPYGSRSQTALRFVLANKSMSCAEVGLAELDHLEQAIAAAEAGPLPQAALDRLEVLYRRDFGLV